MLLDEYQIAGPEDSEKGAYGEREGESMRGLYTVMVYLALSVSQFIIPNTGKISPGVVH